MYLAGQNSVFSVSMLIKPKCLCISTYKMLNKFCSVKFSISLLWFYSRLLVANKEGKKIASEEESDKVTYI